MGLFQYDFGYGFLWNYGHVLAIVPFGVLAVIARRLGWSRWIVITSLLVALWGVVGLLIVQLAMRINLPLELPTPQFFPAGEGLVLDGGAGSGRASLMVLRERSGARVLAVDLYEGYFGIADNTPQRLLDNAARAGVEGRVEARAGDLTDLQLEDASVDAAVSAYVIDHLSQEDVQRALAEIERVLRPNGDFLLMVINPDKWIRIASPFFVHHGYFGGRTRHERWRSRLEQAGFAVVEMGTTPGSLYLLARKGAGANSSETGG